MAKVSLRIYNREIESLVEQGRTDEAVAHCHHILRTFPKNLETYRLLGKAYLESKRFGDAVDIFSRVLNAVPEDFIAHVGMSIIRDEQNKLDDSIWHMERAFESQPSNAAIQSELQRLYARRDGVEPLKIRMTRGALAFMYVQGELYPQAIAEVRSVLAEDPNRGDMKVLLARAYFRSGQKADASDMCAQLLKQYPYCLDANRIMMELLPATAGATESTQVYRTRVVEMDPYATFAKGSVFQSNQVADAAVNLEKLEYSAAEKTAETNWDSSLGIGLGAASAIAGSSSDEHPEWLKSGSVSEDAIYARPLPDDEPVPAKSEEGIPDFLRAAGWGESNTPEQPSSFFDQEPAADNNLVPADLPDWLKGQAPSAASTPQAAPPLSMDQTPDWLTGLGNNVQPVESVPAQSDDIKTWLSGLDNAQEAKAVPASQSDDLPDWLGGLGDVKASEPATTPTPSEEVDNWRRSLDEAKSSEPAQQASDIPDWLSGLGGAGLAGTPAQPANVPDWLNEPKTSEPAQPADAPDWLAGQNDAKVSEPASAQTGDVPSWLSGLDDAKSTEPVDVPDWLSGLDDAKTSEPASSETGDVSEFLSNLDNQPAQPQASVEELGSSSQEQDAGVAWLESLAAKHGAKPEELVTDPNKRSETPPEWVQQAQNINQQTMAQPSIESLGASSQEQDDGVAWLESLAAKHGAKPEELVTDPNKRSETPPEWVQQARAASEAEPVKSQDEQPAPVEGALNIGEQFFAEFENTSTSVAPADETGMWLRNLDEKEKQEEPKEVPAWMKDLKFLSEQSEKQSHPTPPEVPQWLSGDHSVSQDQVQEEPAAQNSDLPNWLSSMDEEAPAKNVISEPGLQDQDLSSWLSGLDDEPGLPFDAYPTPNSILADAMPRLNNSVPVEKPEPVADKSSELPSWLSDVDAKPQEDLEDDLWKKSVDMEAVAASVPTEEPAPVILEAELPDWLQTAQTESAQVAEDVNAESDDTPPWLHREKYEADEPVQPTPTSPSDWHPVEAKETIPAPMQKEEPVIEAAREPVVQQETPARKKSGLSARTSQPEVNVSELLTQAKSELDRGDIPTALNHYGKLIKKGKNLEECIRDLSESQYRYPVEVGIWQTLGDAYMRSNRLKEALEAYNKAEELIR
ncbi:MAG: tetratricopeptide repeat protein [Chloroflexi bacterium]|nr:tetratricopeptide repeat protein [Chloroflexota bacterium]